MLKIVKIGGNIVDNPEKLDEFLADFASVEGDKILVHGGGKVATTISKALGIETTMIEGRRVTDAETLKVVTMVYAGVINKTIVAKLSTMCSKVIGVCGADGGVILSKKRAANPIDYGFVGDPVSVNTELLGELTGKGYTVVVAPITLDKQAGTLLNTNADTIASTLAVAMAQSGVETELIYCFEKRGVMRNIDDEASLIERITPEYAEQLKSEGIIADGMIPKIDNAVSAINKGVSGVVICAAENIAKEGYGGTTITL